MNKLEQMANKQRQLGNTCYFLYTNGCAILDKTKDPCLNGKYNRCETYQDLIMRMQYK